MTCVERSGERLAALCLQRLCCVSSAWPQCLGGGARARVGPASVQLKRFSRGARIPQFLAAAQSSRRHHIQGGRSGAGAQTPLTKARRCGCRETTETRTTAGRAPGRPLKHAYKPNAANVRPDWLGREGNRPEHRCARRRRRLPTASETAQKAPTKAHPSLTGAGQRRLIRRAAPSPSKYGQDRRHTH